MVACRPEMDDQLPEPPFIEAGEGVFVLNEGGFGKGNASIGYYAYGSGEYRGDLFRQTNNRPLGDILQSIYVKEDQAWLVLNNSNRVEEVQFPEMTLLGSIDTLTSPRHFQPIANDRALVTDLFAKSIAVVDLLSHSIINSIPTTDWTEEMTIAKGQVFIAQRNSSWVYVVDVDAGTLTDSIEVAFDPSALLTDKNEMVWVLCSDALIQIEPESKTQLKSLSFDYPISGWPRLETNGEKDTLYVLNNDLFRLSIQAESFPESPFLEQSGNWYGLGVDPLQGYILIGEASNFQDTGEVLRYSTDGTIEEVIPVGVIPNSFYFY